MSRTWHSVPADWLAKIDAVFLHEFDPFRSHFWFSGKGMHGYSWQVAVIVATFLIRRSSYTISSSWLHSPLAFHHLVEFIKPADVTDIHPLNF